MSFQSKCDDHLWSSDRRDFQGVNVEDIGCRADGRWQYGACEARHIAFHRDSFRVLQGECASIECCMFVEVSRHHEQCLESTLDTRQTEFLPEYCHQIDKRHPVRIFFE